VGSKSGSSSRITDLDERLTHLSSFFSFLGGGDSVVFFDSSDSDSGGGMTFLVSLGYFGVSI